ncbi:flippase [Thermococcus barophilus]|uniref:Polysaccharide biosynthesis related protein n=1 Tax=Thermococcus barophilus TaxID=55802 RepID=A0A0S1XF95_THEBA|nr:flippase [Thermococcus barophilus]ALM76386.1 Polysaccharide biosynthesis related protein [Thermococcus barophilus]
MSDATQALHKIARGTGIIFAGTVFSMFFGFLSRAIIAREFSKAEYGVFNLALTILSIGLVIATLGFQNALPREVAFCREKMPEKVDRLISTALIIVAVNSFVIMMFLIFGSSFIAQVFNEERLVYALKVVAFALPFSALTAVIISASRGFGRVREKVYFQNVVYPVLWLILVLSLAALNLSFTSIFWIYVLAQSVMFFVLFFEVFRVRIFEIKLYLDRKIGKELVKFSIPLMLTGIAGFVMTWTDTLMLGYYKGSDVVGLYNAATPLARLLPVFLSSSAFLYPAMVSPLYVQGEIEEMKRVYQVLTKWVFLLTLPIFSLMFLFPETVINFFFGAKYFPAASALQILALGFMFHTFLGLNGLSLIVIKESRFVMYSTVISAVINVVLNALLIPLYGIEGAATATAVSYFVTNVLNSLRLYQRTKIHPFSWNYVKPLAISFVLLGVIKGLNLRMASIWYAIPVLVVFLGVYALFVLLSRSIDKEDVELLLAVEKRLGVDLGIIKRILRRFV